MNKELRDRAFQLRFNCNYSYRDIQKELNISKGTLSYWFSEESRKNQKKRTKKYRQSPESRLRRKLSREFDITDISTKQLIAHIKRKSFCHICGDDIDIFNQTFDLDHIKPKSKGGSNRLSNMHPAHSNCNYMKGKMHFEDFLKRVEKVYKYQKNKEKK